MTESSAEGTPYAPPPTSPGYPVENGGDEWCQDPAEYYPDYLVEAAVAVKRSELYTADKEKVDEKYQKLDGAQTRYEEKWNAQKKAAENLKCQLKQILDTLYDTVDEAKRTHLKNCWCQIVSQTDDDTKPVDCSEIETLDCDDLPTDIAELRRLETRAAACVTRYDAEFDELAEFPDKIEELITRWTERATALEAAIAAPGNDPQRSYVEYLGLERVVVKFWRKLRDSAAQYGCKLKDAFRTLLEMHRKSICLQVAVHKYDKAQEYEEDAKKENAEKVIDRVLECALPKPSEEPEQPDKPVVYESDCKPGGETEPYGETKPGGETEPYGETKPGGETKPYGETPPGPGYQGQGPGQPAGAAC